MTKRQKEINKIICILERAKQMAKGGCIGVPDNVISLTYKGLKAMFGVIADDDEALSVCDTADRYSVTTTTIYNWLKKHELPMPERIEDAQRVYIPRYVIDELDKYYDHKT